MVEPGEMVKAKEGEEKKVSQSNKKKHHGRNNNVAKHANQDVLELLRRVEFSRA